MNGVVVDGLGTCNGRMQALEVRCFRGDAGNRSDHILGGEIGAIVELHTLAKCQTKCLSIWAKTPRGCKSGLKLISWTNFNKA
jgi:hypothetical protein